MGPQISEVDERGEIQKVMGQRQDSKRWTTEMEEAQFTQMTPAWDQAQVMGGMKTSRLAENSWKTTSNVLASLQKRAILKKNGDGRIFAANKEGKKIEKMYKEPYMSVGDSAP